MTDLKKACEQCPWRLSNQGKRHFGGFYTKKNLTRLWNQIRNGGGQQSCHLTDPRHPDHIQSGCKTKDIEATQECPGSIILVQRELMQLDSIKNFEKYRKRKRGLTKRGIVYWAFERLTMGGTPLGGPKLPPIQDDDAVGLPEYLREEG